MLKKRRKLKDLAYGIASSFVSRNNDYEGYWAIGFLSKAALNQHLDILTFNVLEQKLLRGDDTIRKLFLNYVDSITKIKEKFKFDPLLIKSITIELRFNLSFSQISKVAAYMLSGRGTPATCKVTIVDDRGKSHQSIFEYFCAPHDPLLELRSTRFEG